MTGIEPILERARAGGRPSPAEAVTLAGADDLPALMAAAEAIAQAGHGRRVSY